MFHTKKTKNTDPNLHVYGVRHFGTALLGPFEVNSELRRRRGSSFGGVGNSWVFFEREEHRRIEDVWFLWVFQQSQRNIVEIYWFAIVGSTSRPDPFECFGSFVLKLFL